MLFGAEDKNKEDKVVASYSVFLSPKFGSDMHVFQFPLREKDRPYEADRVKLFCTEGIQSEEETPSPSSSSHVVNGRSRLQMTLELDTFGSNSFAKHPKIQENGHRYSYSLQSKPFQPKSDYVVAYIDKNGFHFSPVSTVQQFTPLLRDEWGMMPSAKASPAVKEEGSAVGRPFSSESLPLDRSSREYLKQRSEMLSKDATTTKEVQVFQSGSPESRAAQARLASPTLEMAKTQMSVLSRQQIENCLFPLEEYYASERPVSIVRRFSSYYPLEYRIRELMSRCQILPLERIIHCVGEAQECLSEKVVVGVLLKQALFMHGVWISYDSPEFKGVADALRGVVLSHFFFSRDGTVSREHLSGLLVSSLLRRTLKGVLEQLATLIEVEDGGSARRVWRLKYTTSSTSGSQYESIRALFPVEVDKHAQMLTQAFGRADSLVALINKGRGISIFNGMVSEPQSRDGAVKNQRPAELSPQEEGIVRDISVNIRSILAKAGVKTREALKMKILDDRREKYPSATPTMMQLAIQGTVQPFTSSTVILKTVGDEFIDAHRQSILRGILSLKNFSIAQLTEELEKKLPTEHIPKEVVHAVVSEVAVFSRRDNQYNIKNGLDGS